MAGSPPSPAQLPGCAAGLYLGWSTVVYTERSQQQGLHSSKQAPRWRLVPSGPASSEMLHQSRAGPAASVSRPLHEGVGPVDSGS